MPHFAELTGRGVITVTGADRVAFLQGLISNDVTRATAGKPVWAALLTAQGKFRHDFFLLSQDNRLLLDCEGGDRMMDLGQTLRRYVLRADAKLGIDQELSCFALWGAGSHDIIELPDGEYQREFAGGIAFSDPRLPEMGIRILAPRDAIRARLLELDAVEGDRNDWDSHRIPLGIPDGGRDMQPDKAILLEAGFDELHGVDWQKGCYMGQELTARTKYRGLVKKRLIPVRLTGNAPEEGVQVTTDQGKDAGTLFSIADGWGLALLRLDAVKGKAALTAGGAALTPVIPGWIDLKDD